jgi:hypothetical protein
MYISAASEIFLCRGQYRDGRILIESHAPLQPNYPPRYIVLTVEPSPITLRAPETEHAMSPMQRDML